MTKQKESDKSKEQVEQTSRTIFSENEIRITVKAFVMGFLRGTIKVSFPTIESIKKVQERQGLNVDNKTVVSLEDSLKNDFLDAIEIVSGTQKSTIEEQEESIRYIFSTILSARSANRIHGDFLEFELEKKIDDLEHKLNATNNVVEELIKWLVESEKGYDGNLS